ncbi:MAG: SDR family oxidoreductase [Chloroflexota bacterium]|nr:MAG: SDR family oxidoreductase [Chloroflexota bacterium]
MSVLDRFSLAGRVAIVTGASRGIGAGIAIALAEAGADVALVARDAEALAAQAERIAKLGRRVTTHPFDVANVEGAPAVVDAVVAGLGRVNILVNGAGAITRNPILDVQPEEFDRVIDTNLRAVYFMSQAAARAMIALRRADATAPRAKIINIASLTSQIAYQNIVSYGASRSGVLGLTRGMAIEWREHISVNALAPGYIKTGQTERLYEDPAWVGRILSRIPMGRTGEIDDVTGLAVTLASSASDYLTGQIIYVDGGSLAAG